LTVLADVYLLKQHLQNKVLCTTGNFAKCMMTHELHVASNIPHAHDFITQLCRQQTKVIRSHTNAMFITQHRMYKKLKTWW